MFDIRLFDGLNNSERKPPSYRVFAFKHSLRENSGKKKPAPRFTRSRLHIKSLFFILPLLLLADRHRAYFQAYAESRQKHLRYIPHLPLYGPLLE